MHDYPTVALRGSGPHTALRELKQREKKGKSSKKGSKSSHYKSKSSKKGSKSSHYESKSTEQGSTATAWWTWSNGRCKPGKCADDGDKCTINKCNQSTGTCEAEPLWCGANKACDSLTGVCKVVQQTNQRPNIWNGRDYMPNWAIVRDRFPQLPDPTVLDDESKGCESVTCPDDGDKCTINECNQITGICETKPVLCGPDEACDSFTGLCQSVQKIIPCVAIIDEWDSRDYTTEWSTFRANYPQRPFCLLVPNTLIQTLPAGFEDDSVNNPEGIDRTVLTTVNRDNSVVARASDWFGACDFLGNLSPSSVNYIGLFVDTSGSMNLSTVLASYEKFLADLQAAGFGYRKVFNRYEKWIEPFLTTLAPPN